MKRMIMVMLLSALTLLGGVSGVSWANPPDRPPPPRGVVTLPGSVQQARQAPRGQKVTVGIMVVHATEAHSNVDERLNSVIRHLSHMRYTGYELLGAHETELTPGGSQTFSIQGNREMTITLLSRDERQVRLRVQVMAGRGNKLVDTTLSANRNGTFFVAGPKYRDGILVLPLTARY
jgi:hypothetical protein